MSLSPAQFPAPGSAQVAGKGRAKVALKPGHSLMDWIRLSNSRPDMPGTGGRILKVTPEELAKHNKPGDCWMALRGRVYNISAYLDFHPGGEDELMRGAGIDGTQLFDEVHRWVNAESMLAKCFVGPLIGDASTAMTNPAVTRVKRASLSALSINGTVGSLPKLPGPVAPGAEDSADNPTSISVPFGGMPPPQINVPTEISSAQRQAEPSSPPKPRYDWMQNEKSIMVVIYTKCKMLHSEHVIITCHRRDLTITVCIGEFTYVVHIELEHDVENSFDVKVNSPSGKCEVTLNKLKVEHRWTKLGASLPEDDSFLKATERAMCYHQCIVSSIEDVSHNTKLYAFQLPKSVYMRVPLGYHVYAQAEICGMEISRAYTVVPPSLVDDLDDDVKSGKKFCLMIKIYPEGALTPYIGGLSVGSSLSFSYYDGTFREQRLLDCSHLVLLAAGTGLTPMTGLLWAATHTCHDPQRKLRLLFFNKTEEDILWKDQLEQLSQKYGLSVTHVLSKPSSKWAGPKGRVRRELLEGSIAVPGEGKKILLCVCGPTAFTDTSLQLTKELGYTDEMIHAFIG